jgi:hypothetical protein
MIRFDRTDWTTPLLAEHPFCTYGNHVPLAVFIAH